MAKYINDPRLTDRVIEGIMNRCGLDLIRAKYDDITGQVVPIDPIIRTEDLITVSCTNREMLAFASKFAEFSSMFKMFNTGAYSMGDEIVVLEDFMASRFKITPEMDELDENLFKEYYKTMKLVFGKEFECTAIDENTVELKVKPGCAYLFECEMK